MDETSSRDRRILVTGGAGFIGSHVCEAYLDRGWEVVALDALVSGRPENVPEGAELVEMDVRSDRVDGLLEGGGFDVVNHHAAQMDVRVSVEDPRLDASVNIDGTVNLLEACRRHGVRRFVFASSGGTVYGEPHDLPVSEEYPKDPASPYGISKLAGEHYVRLYHEAHGVEGVCLRYANVYGPRQDPHGEAGVVAIFGRSVLDGEPLTVYGDGEQTRDYVFVRDVARANILATGMDLAAPDSIDANAFNVGTGRETSVNELASAIRAVASRDVELRHVEPRSGELRRSALDADKLRARSWQPATTLDEGLRATLEHLHRAADDPASSLA